MIKDGNYSQSFTKKGYAAEKNPFPKLGDIFLPFEVYTFNERLVSKSCNHSVGAIESKDERIY